VGDGSLGEPGGAKQRRVHVNVGIDEARQEKSREGPGKTFHRPDDAILVNDPPREDLPGDHIDDVAFDEQAHFRRTPLILS
jgi:hypothetical protein